MAVAASLAALSSTAEPKLRYFDFSLRLPRNYIPAALPAHPIDKELQIGVVPPTYVRERSATFSSPAKWIGTYIFEPIPEENITEIDLTLINVAEPVAKALPGIFRRLFPRSKMLADRDCVACDLVFIINVESSALANDRRVSPLAIEKSRFSTGVSVTVSMVAFDRDNVTVGTFSGEAIRSTESRYWSVKGISGPPLREAMERLFAEVTDDPKLRAFVREKAAERARPSDLETTVAFDDEASFFPHGRLDAGESARLRFRIRNQGAGPAFAVKLRLSAVAKAVSLPAEVDVGDIPPGGEKEVDVPLSAGIDVETARQQLSVETLEKRGYGGRPVVVQLATERLRKPTLEIADIRLEDRGGRALGDGDGRPSNGETLEAVILVSNSGPGDAVGAALTFSSTPDVELLDPPMTVGAIAVNAVKEVRALLRIPINYDGPDLGLTVRATETRGSSVASADGQRRWALYRKRPQVEIGFRLFDGNSLKSLGNRDGIANNGETLEVTLTPRNQGALGARGVRLALVTSVPGVEIRPASIDVGELPPLAEGAEHRVQVTVPRALGREDQLQMLPLDVTIAQTDFAAGEQLIGLPFAVLRPQLVAAIAGQSPLVEGKPALFVLDLTNHGALAAEDVKVEVTSDNPAVELLDASGKPVRVLQVDVGSIAAEMASRRIQLRAHIRRNVAALASSLEVAVSQRDFAGIGAQAALTILKEEPALISAIPPIMTAPSVPRSASVPATVSFQRYPDGSTVADEKVRLSFEVQSPTRIEMVRLEQNRRTIELPEDAPIRSGETFVWQYEPLVSLEYGPNEFEVVVITSEGLRNSRSMTLHREKPQGKVWLAVVGISGYRDPSIADLAFAKHDAIAVRAYYRERGLPEEQIIELLDEEATLSNMKRSLGTELVRRAANPDDMVLIYFAGHGVMEADRSSADSDGYSKYLLPHDANQSDLFGSALSMEELSRILQRLRAERVVLIIDSCFSGAAGGRTPFEPNAASRGVITDEFLARIASFGRGRVILTASGSREVALESAETGHGIFTWFLLEGLRGAADTDGDGRVDVDEIYKFVSQKVSAATRGRQNPMRKSPNLTGTVIVGGRLQ